jgi:hypothetical protein
LIVAKCISSRFESALFKEKSAYPLTASRKHGEIKHLERISFERLSMKSKNFARIAALLATLSVATSAIAQWVWVDEHGVKQFTDVAPPANVPLNHILKQPRGSAILPKAEATEDKSGDDVNSAPKEPPTTADREADYKKRKTEQAEKDKKAAEEAKRTQTNAENCANAKKYLDNLNSGQRITTVDSKGERTYLSDDERAKETARTQDIAGSCN